MKHQRCIGMNATHITIYFNLENQTRIFYTIFPVKKNKCWKNFKIMRKLLFNYSFYSHPEIGKISGCDNSTPLKGISSRDSRNVSKKQRLMWVLSKAYQLSSYRPSLYKHTEHDLLFSIAHWSCIGIYSLVSLMTYPLFHHCDFSTLRFAPS
jgi:hypothetical protein